jgi:glutamyl-tRNA synthetase
MSEMVQAFDIGKVSSNPARFDLKKAEAINATHLRALPQDDFVERTLPYLAAAGLIAEKPTDEQRALFTAAAPLIQERLIVLSDAVGMVRFLFESEEDFAPEPDSAAKALGADAHPVLDAAIAALEAVANWTTPAIEEALKAALIDGLGLKPRKAFAPVRVAVTGRTVSPPLYESLELLGRERTVTRMRQARNA